MNVLIVEDNALVADGLVRMLAHLGHRAERALGVEEATRLLAEHADIGVAIVDAGLKNGDDGVWFLEWLREHHPQIRRVLVSGLGRPQRFVERPPEQVFVKKPFGKAELQSVLAARSK
jgi:DNA-binding NtrC family response regulator